MTTPRRPVMSAVAYNLAFKREQETKRAGARAVLAAALAKRDADYIRAFGGHLGAVRGRIGGGRAPAQPRVSPDSYLRR